MDANRTTRGAWRRTPILPRALTLRGGPTLSAPTPWPEEREVRRGGEAAAGRAAASATEAGEGVAEARVRTGGCLCGAVRYEVTGKPLVVGLCHCADCRKATGGYALHYADWPVGAVRIEGPLRTWGGRSFCPDCGARVVHLNADHTELMLGTLDDPPNDLVPMREIWTVRREPWVQPVPGAEQFERDAT